MNKVSHCFQVLLLLALLAGCTAPPPPLPTAAPTLDASVLAARETALASTQLALEAPPTATLTATPTVTPTPTETPVPPTPSVTPTPTPQFADFAAGQRILLHEDIVQSQGAAKPYVAEALRRAGLQYDTTNGNIGTLKGKLGQPWDLVIIAAEMKGNLQGEFLDLIDGHVYRGGALILETWLLDDALKGKKFSYLLSACDLELQGEYKETNYRRLEWTEPDHPLLQSPNQGMSLEKFDLFWRGDLGDLLRKKPGSASQVLASTSGSNESEAVLTVCRDGQVILQTFSTHDHREEDMVPLWHNYIDYALQARFRQQQAQTHDPDPVQEFKHNAQILVYKPPLIAVRSFASDLPYIEALRMGGVEVTAEKGTEQIKSAMMRKHWDLIIIGDYRQEFDANFWPLLRRQLENGAAVVYEKSDLQPPAGSWNDTVMREFLAGCGVQPAGLYAVSQRLTPGWLAPDHPLAGIPFPAHMPAANRLGTLVSLLPESQAQLVAGVEKDGVPAAFVFTAYDGRLVMQTVQSSQYDPWSMIQAWDAYISYALRQRLQYLEANP